MHRPRRRTPLTPSRSPSVRCGEAAPCVGWSRRRFDDSGGQTVIASVNGQVVAVTGDTAVVEVGGVGLAVQCTPSTLATLRPGMRAQLATSLVVREDSLTLFGFASTDERVVFDVLQSVTGVGPKL